MFSQLERPLSLDPSQKLPLHFRVFLAVELLLVLSYASKSLQGRFTMFVPIACICLWILACTRADLPPMELTLDVQTAIGCRAVSIILGASTSVLEKISSDSEEERKNSNEVSVLRNLWAGLQRWFNPRRINTASEPTSSLAPRPHPTTERFLFVIRQLLWGIFQFCLLDISTTLLHFYHIRRQTSTEPMSILDHAFGHRMALMASVSFFGMIYTTLSCTQYAISAFCVALGITNPSDWPPLFNFTFEAASTLGKFWGTFWHQMLRKLSLFTTHANFFSELLRFPRHSRTTRYFKLFCSFGLSALIHLGGDGFALQSVSNFGCVKFFMLQPVAIVFEDGIVGLTSRLTGGRLPARRDIRRLLGCLWVLFWLRCTLPIWIDPLLDAGFVDTVNQGYFSPVMGLWKGLWFRQNFNTRIWYDTFRVQSH